MQAKWCKLGADFPLFKLLSRQWESQNPHPVPPKNGGTRMGHPRRFV